ncbi:MAG: T9SS type A sorting domain-containing protein, partial [Bacteroidetes bacterium]|nr:T9SS type A sorting domain-containing protein [Bacteroidota bacterium]
IQRMLDPKFQLSAEDTAKFIAKFTDLPLVTALEEGELDDKLVEITGDAVIRREGIFPVKKVGSNGVSVLMTNPLDYVALFGGIVANLDNDNNQEVYFPLYGGLSDTLDGALFVVDYNQGDDVQKANGNHAVKIATKVSQSTSGAGISNFTGVEADLDRNGKKEILIGSAYPSNVVAIEYNGSGSLRDPNSYTRKVLYTGESDVFATVTYRDSLGTRDTVKTIGEGFVSKMSKAMDIDGDGRVEVVLPYQSVADSITYTWQHFDNLTQAFIDDSSKKVTNPKKWAFRLLESNIVGSVDGKDVAVITPEDYQLNQNYPNPFNPSTTINFVLPLSKKITLRVYDMVGKEVATLVNGEEYAKGSHAVVWNGRDKSGKSVASGAYIATMTTGNISKSIKMMLLK